MDKTLRHIDGWDGYVVAVVTDNAANFEAAGRILHEKNPHIVWEPCAAHCIDLIMEDVSKMEEVHKTIEEGKTMIGLIYNLQFMTDRFREMNQGCELLRPGITQFVTHFVALESLCRAKANIMQIWTSTTYLTSKFSRHPLARHVQEIIPGTTFW